MHLSRVGRVSLHAGDLDGKTNMDHFKTRQLLHYYTGASTFRVDINKLYYILTLSDTIWRMSAQIYIKSLYCTFFGPPAAFQKPALQRYQRASSPSCAYQLTRLLDSDFCHRYRIVLMNTHGAARNCAGEMVTGRVRFIRRGRAVTRAI